MKNLVKRIVELAYGAKIHADHTAIKGRKSGGSRDANGTDWKEKAGSTVTS